MTRDAMVRKLHARITLLAHQTDSEAEALYLRIFPDVAERAQHAADERALAEGRRTSACISREPEGIDVDGMSNETAAAMLALLTGAQPT